MTWPLFAKTPISRITSPLRLTKWQDYFLTKESDKDFVKKDLSKRIDLNYVSFVECDYSYAELMELDKWLFDFFTKNENKSFLNTLHVDGWNINKNKNKIIIKLNDCSSFYINPQIRNL